ncbi:nucleotidyltransferase [Devosia pacifica]|uniref:Nucleotidyltransferase n=1 Tax=Devosia pacifica TaxID=1335967 RepID=A0A918S0V1_9HYPH|nr:nucleotidyltransferase domain-containing protein [Devosia pacifica]GHA16691.1 nucleotidyltransferase [Devosia pacifica]
MSSAETTIVPRAMSPEAALAFLADYVPHRFPDADTALLAGSTATGTAQPGSDLDLVIVYPKLDAGAWRTTERADGVLIEAFVHDLGTLAYFLEDLDRASGLSTLANLVRDGLPVPGMPQRLLSDAKAMADRVLALGPPAIDREAIDRRRYLITNLLDDLAGQRPSDERLAIATELHRALADFVLRAAGKYGGNGKGIARALAAHDAQFASALETATIEVLASRGMSDLQRVVETALAPHGGLLMEGYTAHAPAHWRRLPDSV